MKELPLNGRSFDNLVHVKPKCDQLYLKKSEYQHQQWQYIHSCGPPSHGELIPLEWNRGIRVPASCQSRPGGVSGQLLGVDAVREFNLLTDNYSAEYGKRAGAQVSVITQSGSNTVHGSVFEFIRNNKLDARNFFDQGRQSSPFPAQSIRRSAWRPS